MPQEAHLRCRLWEPHDRFAITFVQRRRTKRSLEKDGFHAVGVSNLPRSGKLRGCLNAKEDALDMYFTCGLSYANGADEGQPKHRPKQEECGPQVCAFAGEDASCDYRGDAPCVEQADEEQRYGPASSPTRTGAKRRPAQSLSGSCSESRCRRLKGRRAGGRCFRRVSRGDRGPGSAQIAARR